MPSEIREATDLGCPNQNMRRTMIATTIPIRIAVLLRFLWRGMVALGWNLRRIRSVHQLILNRMQGEKKYHHLWGEISKVSARGYPLENPLEWCRGIILKALEDLWKHQWPSINRVLHAGGFYHLRDWIGLIKAGDLWQDRRQGLNVTCMEECLVSKKTPWSCCGHSTKIVSLLRTEYFFAKPAR